MDPTAESREAWSSLEVAFAVILLVGAALMTRTLSNLNAIDAGFEPDGLITMHIALPSDRYPNMTAYVAFFDTLSEKLRGIPGISGAAVSQGAPPRIGGISFGNPEIEGHGTPDTKTMVIPNGTGRSDLLRHAGDSAGRGPQLPAGRA